MMPHTQLRSLPQVRSGTEVSATLQRGFFHSLVCVSEAEITHRLIADAAQRRDT